MVSHNMLHESAHLETILVFLAAAVLAVAMFRKLNASPVVGYLMAGALIGPHGIGFIPDSGSTSQIAEFGVMFLLFIIGLELSWERLQAMRRNVFGVAVAQVLICTAIATSGLHALGLSYKVAAVIGGALSLSSTALVMQILEEKQQNASQLGRLSLAVLLVQDLAAVPLLVVIPVLAHPEMSLGRELFELGGKAALALGLILLTGRMLLGHLFRVIASLDTPEISTAFTLMLVLGTGYVTQLAGLSLPLGAFLAGLLMAETEYRHQVEADVLPFKGLFLGLFFMATGMSVSIGSLLQNFPLIIAFTLSIMLLKTAVIGCLCRLFSFSSTLAVQAGLLLSQGGEFAFIVFSLAENNQLIPPHLGEAITVAVTLSMALTPLAVALGNGFARRSEQRRKRGAEDLMEEMTDIKNHVIILGFGRVGQTIAKFLSAENIPYIAIDSQVSTVLRARKIGLPVYYGDASRREVQQAIGVDRARAAIITHNDTIAAERAARGMRAAVPGMPIIARARGLREVQALEASGANIAVSEMFEASLQLGGALLKCIGIAEHEILRITQMFRDSDYALARGTMDVRPGDATSPHSGKVGFGKAAISASLTDIHDFEI